jgi:hypothetical protein
MTTQPPPEPAPLLSQKATYGGACMRIVEPDRHIYRATMEFERWFGGIALAGISIGFGFMTRFIWKDDGPLFFLLMFGVGSLFTGTFSFLEFFRRARLTITPHGIALRKKGFLFGNTAGTRRWRLEDIETVSVRAIPTFHIGGMTPLYVIALVFADGAEEGLGMISTMYRPSAERLAADITASILQMAERSVE